MNQKKSIKTEPGLTPRVYTVDLHSIPVTVTRKRIKTIRLYVRSSDHSVHLSIPTSVPNERAMLFLSSKESWLRRTLARLPASLPEERYESGEGLFFAGERYTLSVTEQGRRYALSLSPETHVAHFTVPIGSNREGREKFIREYYRSSLEEQLSEIIPKWEGITGLSCASHDVRPMKTRWGSCNVTTRHIRLNLYLARYPSICTEYVVLHELCHLRVPNHGAEFKALLDRYMPDWRSVRALLNKK
ncbi:MAG: M48 family metallopeptidase [Clostridia bacterium]|nr:M48 family metallopeptidase [Clostridia bacterium]